jgi:HAD superfamily hydrolase (TIGR01549 family)
MARLYLPERDIPLKACGLDVDGVLRDTGMHIYEATCRTIVDLGGTAPSYIDYLLAQDAHEEYLLVERCGVVASHEEIDEAYLQRVPSHDDEPPFEDVHSFLAELAARNLKLFVVSRHENDLLTDWFRNHRLDHHIERLQGSSRDKSGHIREICAHLGVSPEETCYVGDMGGDMKAAKAAGTVPIGITRAYETREILRSAGAEEIIEHLPELIQKIR